MLGISTAINGAFYVWDFKNLKRNVLILGFRNRRVLTIKQNRV